MTGPDDTFRLGVGLYPLSTAARIIGAPLPKVRRWARESSSVISRSLPRDENTLTFLELMELNFISMFRKEGVSLQAIKKAARLASERFDTRYPFAVKRFDTDGKTIFATLISETNDSELIEDLQAGQYVFGEILRPFFRKLEYGQQEIARFWPLGKSRRIVLDPQRQFGKPIDSETGVPAAALYEATIAGGGQDERTVAKWYNVPLSAVRRAVEYEHSVSA